MFELGDAVGFFLYNMNIKANGFKAINKTAETPFLIEEDLNLGTTPTVIDEDNPVKKIANVEDFFFGKATGTATKNNTLKLTNGDQIEVMNRTDFENGEEYTVSGPTAFWGTYSNTKHSYQMIDTSK